MRLAYTAVAALAALLSCSDSVPTAGDPEAVLEHDVSLVAHKTNGNDYGVDAKRLLRATGGEENGPYPKKVDEEARAVHPDTAAIEKLIPVTTVLATGVFGKTTKQARNAAVEAATAATEKLNSVYKILANGVAEKTAIEVNDALRQEAAVQKAMVFVQKLINMVQQDAKEMDAAVVAVNAGEPGVMAAAKWVKKAKLKAKEVKKLETLASPNMLISEKGKTWWGTFLSQVTKILRDVTDGHQRARANRLRKNGADDKSIEMVTYETVDDATATAAALPGLALAA